MAPNHVDRLTASPATGEIYLTQLVESAVATDARLTHRMVCSDDLVGVNDRHELARR